MYGYTPPAVIAVDPALLSDCGAFQRLAWSLAQQLKRRPVWVVVRSPDELAEADEVDQDPLLESYFMDPNEAPAVVPDDLDEGVALALQSHLRTLGVELPIVLAPVPAQPHAVKSAIVPGVLGDAAELARVLGATRVTMWTEEAQWVPRSVGGVPFDSSRPGGPRIDGVPSVG